MKNTKISSLFPKRGNRNTKRTEKHKNKMTHGKTYNKSPRRINHKATKSKTNTGTTALEWSLWICQKVCKALTFLLDNIYFRFGTKLFRQIVGIPMGSNCASLVADLFLFCYERDFMMSLSVEDQSEMGSGQLGPKTGRPRTTRPIKKSAQDNSAQAIQISEDNSTQTAKDHSAHKSQTRHLLMYFGTFIALYLMYSDTCSETNMITS